VSISLLRRRTMPVTTAMIEPIAKKIADA
jgi:hypothetical protein